MEVEGSSKTKGPDQRLILRCADDAGNFMCFICGDYAPSAKTLYNHLESSSCRYGWRSVLPKNLSDCSTVVVRHTLVNTPDSDSHSHSSIKLKEEGECSSGRFVDKWNIIGIGKRRSKRSAPSPHYHNDRTKEEDAPNYSRNNKSKVVADAPDSTNVKDRVVAEAVGKLVHDFDLNEPPIMELPDDQ